MEQAARLYEQASRLLHEGSYWHLRLEQIADRVALVLQLLQRDLELLLSEGIQLDAFDRQVIALAIGAARVAKHYTGWHTIFSLGNRGGVTQSPVGVACNQFLT